MIFHLINKHNIPKILMLNLIQTQFIFNIHFHHLVIELIIDMKISAISINDVQIDNITKLVYIAIVGSTEEGV